MSMKYAVKNIVSFIGFWLKLPILTVLQSEHVEVKGD